jgi:hypothetical protein
MTVAGAATSRSLLGVHGWHAVEALAFIVVAVAAASIVDRREHRRQDVSRDRGSLGRALLQRLSAEVLVYAAGLATVGAAAVHFVVMPTHFEESSLYGVFFLVTASVQVSWSLAVLARPSRPLLAAGAAGNLAVLALWLVSRTVGIPLGPGAGEVESVGGLDILATALEAVVVVASPLALSHRSLPARRPLRAVVLHRRLVVGVAAAAALVTVTACAAPPS